MCIRDRAHIWHITRIDVTLRSFKTDFSLYFMLKGCKYYNIDGPKTNFKKKSNRLKIKYCLKNFS